jgi:hypothetical protein
VLVEECIEPDRVDTEAQRESLRKAEEVLARIDQEALTQRVREARTTAERDEARQITAEYDNAVADKKRAETFIRLAGGQPE